MSGHAEQCVERYLELSGKEVSSFKNIATPCLDDHLLPPEDFETKGALSLIAARIVVKAFYKARFSRPELLWTVNMLVREVTKMERGVR